MHNRRVVVTGLGIISPLGSDVATTWRNVLAGKSGIGLIDRFDATKLSVKIAGQVQGFDPGLYLDSKEQRKFDMFIWFAVAASQQAFEDSGLIVTKENATRVGTIIGSGMGGLPAIEKNHSSLLQGGPRRISPYFIPGAIINMTSGLVSIKHGLRGPNISIVTACSTGLHNIGHAARMIQYGDADAMVAGGAEMSTTELSIGGFASARALSHRNDDPTRASRPWDKDRDGFVQGEGAGIMVLEEYEHAQARGAKIYAEVTSFGMSSDAHHITMPCISGAVHSMRQALQHAQLNAEDIDYINAHGTSTPVGDLNEALAIKEVLGDHAYRVAISSTKSMMGHLLGAAGAVESILSVLAIRDQIAPPTINLDNPDEGCDLDFVPHTARPMLIRHVMKNSFGFGGTNGTLIFSRCD